MKIPDEKPDVEQINDLITDVEIENIKLIFIKDSRCNQLSPKVIITGKLTEKIIYTADLSDQPVHTAHFTNYFYGNVLLDFDIKLNTNCNYYQKNITNLHAKNLNTYICIEDITIRKFKPKKFVKYITLLLCVNGSLEDFSYKN